MKISNQHLCGPFGMALYKNEKFYFEPNRYNSLACKSYNKFETIWKIETPEYEILHSKIIENKLSLAGKWLFDFETLKIDEIIIPNLIAEQYYFHWDKNLDFLRLTIRNENKFFEGIYDVQNSKILWQKELYTFSSDYVFENEIIIKSIYLDGKIDTYGSKGTQKAFIAFNFLTGSTLWQRSFEELGITQLDKFVGDVGDVLVCAFDEYNLIGLDKTTGNELWRVKHKAKLLNGILNAPSQSIYLFYGWADEDETIEQVNLNLLEIDSQTGQIRYDDDIFKHPNHQAVAGLRGNVFYGYPKFYSALQWGEVIYFLVPISGIGPLAQIMAFDTVQKCIVEVSEQFFTTFHQWFVAEGKLFITAKVGKNIDSEINTDPSYHERVYDTGRFDGTTFHHQYFLISKEE